MLPRPLPVILIAGEKALRERDNLYSVLLSRLESFSDLGQVEIKIPALGLKLAMGDSVSVGVVVVVASGFAGGLVPVG